MEIGRANEYWVFGFGVRAVSGDAPAGSRAAHEAHADEGRARSPAPEKDPPATITFHEEQGRWVPGSGESREVARAETKVHPMREASQTYDLAGRPSPAPPREGANVDIYA